MQDENDVFLQVKKWCLEANLFKTKLPNKENISWAMELSYPFNHPMPISIIVLNYINADFISMQVSIKMCPEYYEEFVARTSDNVESFYFELQKMLLEKELDFNVNVDIASWNIFDTIYFDGLTKNELFKSFRRIYGSVLLGNMILGKIMHQRITG